MARLPILVAPDPLLKKVAAPVARVDDSVRALMDDLLETMYAAPGVGLAAPQVGDLRRVIVIDIAKKNEDPAPLCLANPAIVWSSPELNSYEEGCLSVSEHYSEVTRPERVRVRYLDRQDEIREIEADGLLATVLQHEMDHLQGVLFVDHISSLKRGMILRKLTKAKKQAVEKG